MPGFKPSGGVGTSFTNFKSGAPEASQYTDLERKQAFDAFFGIPRANSIATDPYENRDQNQWNLPDAYRGQSLSIASTIELTTFTEDSYYTNYLLPIRVTDQISIKWNITQFDPKFTSVVPHRGRTRILSSKTISGSANLIRRGIGIELEHGFMTTDKGRKAYVSLLEQVNRSVVETNNLGVVWALLTCQSYDNDVARIRETVSAKQAIDRFDRELKLFAIFQKEDRPLESLNDFVKREMEQSRGKGNTWIMPEKIKGYVTTVPEAYIEFWRAGPLGPSVVSQGINAFATIPGIDERVYFDKGFDVSQSGGPINLLKRPTEYGEYVSSWDLQRGTPENYRSMGRAIRPFNEKRDNFERISLRTMIDNCGRFDPRTGRLKDTTDPNLFRHSGVGDITEDDFNRDVFRTLAKDGKGYKDVRYFGEIRPEHLPVEDLLNISRSAINVMNLETPKKVNSAIRGLSAAIQYLSSLEYSKQVDTWFTLLAKYNIRKGTSTNESVEGSVPEYGHNEFSCLDLPTTDWNVGASGAPAQFPLAAAKADLDLLLLPPGFLSWAGFQTIAAAYDKNPKDFNKNYGFDSVLAKGISEGVHLISNLSQQIKEKFPGCVLNAEGHASAWWHSATPAHTLFETLIDTHQMPFFLAYSNIDRFGYAASGVSLDANPNVLFAFADDTKLAEKSTSKARFTGSAPGDPTAGKRMRHSALSAYLNLAQFASAAIQATLIGEMEPLDLQSTEGAPKKISFEMGFDGSAGKSPLGIKQDEYLVFKNRQSLNKNGQFTIEEMWATKDLPLYAQRRFATGEAASKTSSLFHPKHAASLNFIEAKNKTDAIRIVSDVPAIIGMTGTDPDPLGNVNPGEYKRMYDELVKYVWDYRPSIDLFNSMTAAIADANDSAKSQSEKMAARNIISNAVRKLTQQEEQRALVLSTFAEVSLMKNAASRVKATLPQIQFRLKKVYDAIVSITGSSLDYKTPDGPRLFDYATFLSVVRTLSLQDPDLFKHTWKEMEEGYAEQHKDALKAHENLTNIVMSPNAISEFATLIDSLPQTSNVAAANRFNAILPGYRHDSSNYKRAPITAPAKMYLSWLQYVDSPAGNVKNITAAIPADYERPEQPADIQKLKRLQVLQREKAREWTEIQLKYPGLSQRDRQAIESFNTLIESNSAVINLRYRSSTTTSSSSSSSRAMIYDPVSATSKTSREMYQESLQQTIDMNIGRGMPLLASDGSRGGGKSQLSQIRAQKQSNERMLSYISRVADTSELDNQRASGYMPQKDVEVDLAFADSVNHIMKLLFSKINDISRTPLERIVSKIIACTPVKQQVLHAWDSFDIVMPFTFHLFRPHITHSMLTAIRMQAGAETGNTYMGHSIWEWGDEVATGFYMGDYRYYSRSIVHRPQNVYVAQSVFCDGYIRGNELGFFDLETYAPERGAYGATDASVFCFLGPYTEERLPPKVDLTGYFSLFGRHISMPENERAHTSFSAYYNKMWGFSRRLTQSSRNEAMAIHAIDNRPFNTVAYEGTCQYWDPKDNGFTIETPGTGRWAGYTYTGCAAVRKGALTRARPVDYTNKKTV